MQRSACPQVVRRAKRLLSHEYAVVAPFQHDPGTYRTPAERPRVVCGGWQTTLSAGARRRNGHPASPAGQLPAHRAPSTLVVVGWRPVRPPAELPAVAAEDSVRRRPRRCPPRWMDASVPQHQRSKGPVGRITPTAD